LVRFGPVLAVAALLAAGPLAASSPAWFNSPNFSFPPVPTFTGLNLHQANSRLSDALVYARDTLADINDAQASGEITPSRGAQLRSTLQAGVNQMYANYNTWKASYNPGNGGGGSPDPDPDPDPSPGGSGGGSDGGPTGVASGAGAPPAPAGSDTGTGGGKKKPDSGSKGGGNDRSGGRSPSNGDNSSSTGKTTGGTSAGPLAKTSAAAGLTANTDKPTASDGTKRGGVTPKSQQPNDLRKRAAVSRAVAGIPLGFRIALLFLIFLVALLAIISWRERRRALHVAKVAQLDYLTGLSNREGFDRALAIEWRRAMRYGRPLGIMYIDLDDFKRFNDTHGHLAGDRLLREIAAAINSTARGSDFTARLGGDEFVVLCPETTPEGLEALADRLEAEARGLAVTLSIGYAYQQPTDATPDDLVGRADASMYEAKGERRRSTVMGNPMLGSLRSRR
jgi:diguanylate cyclase (GGDEF)-like protein